MTQAGRLLLRIVLVMYLGGSTWAGYGDMPALCTDPICYYEWDIRWDRSMTYRKDLNSYNVILNETDKTLRIAHNLHRPDDPRTGSVADKHDSLTADAYPRDLIVINGEFPGPGINVMEGSTVEVKVTNHLGTDDTAIHFFGMKQFDNSLGDGVPYVSQCPIRPGQTYTYRFIATPTGTHWYHSSYQSQRIDGLAGIIVVHRREPHLPELYMVLGDWSHVTADPRQRGNPYMWEWPGTGEYEMKEHESHATIVYGPQNENPLPVIRPLYTDIDETGRQAQGEREPVTEELHIPAEADTIEYVHRKDSYNPYIPYGSGYKTSFILNGRGRGDANYYPLHRFFVEPGATYRVRVVHVGSTPGIKFSIDGHKLRVIAADGINTDPHSVDMLFVGPGERFDFELDLLATPGRYWVRVWVHEHYEQSPNELGQLGILTYFADDDDTDDPTSVPVECTQESPCSALNCIPDTLRSFNTTCADLQQVRNVLGHGQNMWVPAEDDHYDEHFLNFAMVDGPTINGVKYYEPTAIPEFGGKSWITCDDDRCDEAPCYCTNTLTFEGNRTIQLVLSNYDTRQGSSLFGHHAVHLHGHPFFLMKQGYPIYDKKLMTVMLANTDIDCGNALCKHATWRHQPEFNYERPVRKDSIVIPTMGYVVIRFKADNPGIWLLTSQIMTYQRSGMQLLTMVSSPTELWTIDQLPRCGHDAWTNTEDAGNRWDGDYEIFELSASFPANECIEAETDGDSIQLTRTTFAFVIVGSIVAGFVIVSAAFYLLLSQMPSQRPGSPERNTRTPLLRDYD